MRGKLGSRFVRKLVLRSIQKLPRSNGYMRGHSTHTASTPSCRTNATKSGGNILLVLQVAICGSILAICPTRPETPCGEGTSHAWRSLRDLSRLSYFPKRL